MTKIFTLGRSREQWGLGAERRHGGGGPRRRGCEVVGHRGRGEESGVGWPGARGWASGIWGCGIEGGSGGIEGGGFEGGGVKVG
jgi:hypothetical protein